jgi:hypothetical protein
VRRTLCNVRRAGCEGPSMRYDASSATHEARHKVSVALAKTPCDERSASVQARRALRSKLDWRDLSLRDYFRARQHRSAGRADAVQAFAYQDFTPGWPRTASYTAMSLR